MKRKALHALGALGFVALVSMGLLVGSGLNDHLGHADVALALGNTVNPDGSPSPRLKARLDKAVELYNQGYFPKIVVSGGTGKEGVPEGTAMRNYLIEEGVPVQAIIVDNEGLDTYASAKNTARILSAEQGKSVLVITQFFHIPRAKLALSKMGIPLVFTAHASYFEPRDIYSTFRELPAYLKYLLRSYGTERSAEQKPRP